MPQSPSICAKDDPAPSPGQGKSLGVFLVLCDPDASGGRVALAHIGAGLCVSVIMRSGKMINFRVGVCPNHGIAGTMGFRLGFVSYTDWPCLALLWAQGEFRGLCGCRGRLRGSGAAQPSGIEF